MTKTTMRAIFTPHALAVAVALGCCAEAQAVDFNLGEIEGTFDSSLSIGASWGMRDADNALVGTVNGGSGQSSTGDDGRLNFSKGETFSKIFKGVHDLQLKYGDSGVFVRGKYWYDFELKDESRPFKDISDHNRKEGAKSSGGQILDAFVYHNYSIADLPGTVRAGKQVVSWGESTFIGNSINSINPIDVSAFRRPGSEIKEGLIPVNMLFATQSLTDRLTVEGFYQLEWDQTVVDNCGTFFGNDVVADGCDNNYTVASPAIRPLQPIAAAFGQGFEVTSEGVVVPRGGDRDARDSGQWGTALRWLGDDTEYGLYFMNYHSRTPTVGTTTAGLSTLAALPGMVGIANGLFTERRPASTAPLAPNDIDGQGQLLTPALVESHVHLDKTLWGQDWRPNSAGPTLKDYISNERQVLREIATPIAERAGALLDRRPALVRGRYRGRPGDRPRRARFVKPALLVFDLDGTLLDTSRDLGVALVEIGADITNVAVFAGGMLLGLQALPMGSGAITDAIADHTDLFLISMGAGAGGHAQYLFADDVLGQNTGHMPRHAKRYRDFAAEYARLQGERVAAFGEYVADVHSARYPAPQYLVDGDPDVTAAFRAWLSESV